MKKLGNNITKGVKKRPLSLPQVTIVTYHHHYFCHGMLRTISPWKTRVKNIIVTSLFCKILQNELFTRHWFSSLVDVVTGKKNVRQKSFRAHVAFWQTLLKDWSAHCPPLSFEQRASHKSLGHGADLKESAPSPLYPLGLIRPPYKITPPPYLFDKKKRFWNWTDCIIRSSTFYKSFSQFQNSDENSYQKGIVRALLEVNWKIRDGFQTMFFKSLN